MELQLPLILFTTLIAWSAGLFATQCVCSVKNVCQNCQLPAWICSAALLALSGLAVFTHLEHWERIFNGFGHLTSGITQELIAIVVLCAWMVVYFAMFRRNDGKIPAWCGGVAVALAVVLCVVMGHSYNMVARPAWDSVLQILSLVGGGLVMGPATVALIGALTGDDADLSLQNAVGSIAGGVLMAVYLVSMSFAGGSMYYLDSYNFDPVYPNAAMYASSTAAVGPFTGEALVPAIITIVAVLVAIAAAIMGKQQKNWKTMAPVIVVAGFVAAVALRVVFYMNGVAAFNYPL